MKGQWLWWACSSLDVRLKEPEVNSPFKKLWWRIAELTYALLSHWVESQPCHHGDPAPACWRGCCKCCLTWQSLRPRPRLPHRIGWLLSQSRSGKAQILSLVETNTCRGVTAGLLFNWISSEYLEKSIAIR